MLVCKHSSVKVLFFEMASSATAAVAVLSIFLSSALSAAGLCCGHPAEDQHERVSQVIPATAVERAGFSERDLETANLVVRDADCATDCCRAGQAAVLPKVLPREKSTQNDGIIAQVAIELLTPDLPTMTTLSSVFPHPPPGTTVSCSILRV